MLYEPDPSPLSSPLTCAALKRRYSHVLVPSRLCILVCLLLPTSRVSLPHPPRTVFQASLDILIISLGAEAGDPLTTTAGGGGGEGGGGEKSTQTAARAPNKFALQNVGKFQRLLGPCLRADTPGIRRRLLRLIQRLAALYAPGPSPAPQEFLEANFWGNLQASVERRIKAALGREKPVAMPSALPAAWYGRVAAAAASLPAAAAAAAVAAAAASASGGAGAAGGGAGLLGLEADRSKALCSVKMVETVAAVFPAYADAHAGSLMDLAKLLSRQHFHQVAAVPAAPAARYGGSAGAAGTVLPPGLAGSDPMLPGSRLLPTPSMAVLTTAVLTPAVNLDVQSDPPLTEHLEVRK